MTLLTDTTGTQVVFSEFRSAQSFGRGLFQGFSHARVLTYSASLKTALWLMDQVETLEVIMGEPKVTASLSAIAAYQHQLQEELFEEAEAAGKHADLLQRLKDGSVRVLVLKEAVSHAKLYLLEGKGKRRVLLGSANLSDRALFDPETSAGGQQHQHEQLIAFDDQQEAWRHYGDEYEQLRTRTQLLKAPVRVGQVTPEDLPLLQAASRAPLIVAFPVHVTAPARDLRYERLVDDYGPALKQAVRRAKGKFVLEAKNLPTVGRVLHDRKAKAESEQVLRLDREGNSLVSTAGFSVKAHLAPDGLSEDAALLTEFFEGYARFSGDSDPLLMQRDYFAFLSWLYISPFMSDLLAEGKRADHSPHKYPLYAVLMGKSSSGKTTAAHVFLRSMIGPNLIDRPGQELGKKNLRGLQAESGRLPVYFNDVEREKLKAIASDLKNTAEMHDGEGLLAPIVISLNGNELGLEDELRKRLHLIQTSHALDPTQLSRKERDELHARASRTKKRIGTAVYSAYLARLLPIVDDPEQLAPVLSDPLKLSSRLLAETLAAAGHRPEWAQEVSVHRDEDRVMEQTRSILLGLWRRPNNSWVIKPDRVIIPLREDIRVGAALMRTIPDSLLLSGSTNANLIVQREGLERLMGTRLKTPWWLFGQAGRLRKVKS